MKFRWIAIAVTLGFIACKKADIPAEKPPTGPTLADIRKGLVDKNASVETAALFFNLKENSNTNILFGHQDDTKRGVVDVNVQWANEDHLPDVPSGKSDVKAVTGSYPAVYGHDFNQIANFIEPGQNWFEYEKQVARQLTIDAYNRGGVNTFSWHYNNPVSKESFYWENSPVEAVSRILPGGDHHETYKKSLRIVADFAKSLFGADGKLVPLIFRPFHEFDGDWFWWGKAHCTATEYKKLYRFTVEYLRDSVGVRNFLYAWSPDRNFTSTAQLMERYPGDAYVDLIGMDNYWDLRPETPISAAASKLKIISDYAKEHGKLAAMTETGLQNISQADWYTQTLLKTLQAENVNLAYVLVWANTSNAYWTPYLGHPAETDFIAFKENDYVQFADEAPEMYELE